MIAILCCLGGITSTYVAYIASAFGSLTGIPMGGQMLSGLHVFWIILILAIVNKKGSGALAGVLKGFVEFITGGHLGILAIPTSFLEGVFAEIGFWPFKKYKTLSFVIAGGLGSWANILVTQTIFNSFPGLYMFGTFSVFAFASGMVFAGYMGLGIVRILTDAGVIKAPAGTKPSKLVSIPGAIAVALVAILAVVVAAYLLTAGQSAGSSSDNGMARIAGGTQFINITGDVAKPGSFDIPGYKSDFITITAVNTHAGGNVAYNYTGVPLKIVLADAGINSNATSMDIIGSDGYTIQYSASDIMSKDDIVLVPENGEVDVISKGSTSNMWVRSIATINVHT